MQSAFSIKIPYSRQTLNDPSVEQVEDHFPPEFVTQSQPLLETATPQMAHSGILSPLSSTYYGDLNAHLPNQKIKIGDTIQTQRTSIYNQIPPKHQLTHPKKKFNDT
jgi:hypothetical protein